MFRFQCSNVYWYRRTLPPGGRQPTSGDKQNFTAKAVVPTRLNLTPLFSRVNKGIRFRGLSLPVVTKVVLCGKIRWKMRLFQTKTTSPDHFKIRSNHVIIANFLGKGIITATRREIFYDMFKKSSLFMEDQIVRRVDPVAVHSSLPFAGNAGSAHVRRNSAEHSRHSRR